MADDGRGKSEGSKKTQFPRGKSGNLRGRPAHAKGLRSQLREELDEMVEITERGKVRRFPKRRLVLKSLVAKAAKGDVRAAEKVLGYIIQFEGFEDQREKKKELSPHDEAVLDYFLSGADEPADPGKDAAVIPGDGPLELPSDDSLDAGS